MPTARTAPLLYPCHLRGGSVQWPTPNGRKPNAIERIARTEGLLYPLGCYVLVRRFSAKEERRRLVAGVVDPVDFPGQSALAFENHLNVYHRQHAGLPEALARGLAVYLNSTAVDQHFRLFSGHTQVNATDLRAMLYPSPADLEELGRKAKDTPSPAQDTIDEMVAPLIA
jgi:hypothetical protein